MDTTADVRSLPVTAAEPAPPVVDAVEVYWRPGCPFCAALRRPLRRTGLPIRETDIWSDPGAAARVRGATGGDETVPTVFVGNRALVNPTVGQVRRLVDEAAPHLAAGVEPHRPWWRRVFGRGSA